MDTGWALRHSKFVGLREDKEAREVMREIGVSPNPTIIEAVSEDDETESRGHPSTAVALSPRRMQHHPRVDAGWRSRHCPIAHGCRACWPRGLKTMSFRVKSMSSISAVKKQDERRMTSTGVFLFAIFLGSVKIGYALELKLGSLNMGYASATPRVAALWIAKEKKIFEKHGLEVNLVAIRGSATTMQALVGGDIDLVYVTGAA